MNATSSDRLRPDHVRFIEFARLGAGGLLARRLRAALSALGISVGVAALVAVVGLSAASQRHLDDRLGRYANLLTAGSGQSLLGTAVPIPAAARGMINRIPPVRRVAAIGVVPGATIRRTELIPATSTGGIAVVAADPALAATLDASMSHGVFLNTATATYPTVVLGAAAARYLGVADARLGQQVDVDNHLFTVVGILAPVEIAPEIDDTAMIGFPIAESLLGFTGAPSRLYVRADIDQLISVRAVLARTVNPEHPEAVTISRASDLLAARLAARTTMSALSLGLGLVALLVGGIGVANVMIIAVLERRNEIGVRRALGATQHHVASQFVIEAVTLGALGGAIGTLLGATAVIGIARAQGWPIALPAITMWGGLAVSIAVGGLAGLYPAHRAATMPPADTLRAT